MATINSISLYLARTHSDSCFVGVGLYAPGGGLVGNTALVAYDDIQHTITGPSWITFTFDTPVTVSETGWYVIRLYITPHTNYDMMGLRWYGASDWTEKPAEEPFTGSEHAVVAGTSPTRAYDMSVDGFTANYAREPTEDYYSQSDNGIQIQSYLEFEPEELTKPKNPTPANGSGPGIDVSNYTLSWEDGGMATGYRVKFPFAEASPVQSGTSYVIPESLRANFKDTVVSWRVDATDGENWVTGDTWTFDPRPEEVTYVSPADEATDQTLHAGAEWEAAAAAETYTFRIIQKDGVLPTVIPGLTAVELANIGAYLTLRHNTTYYWRVDTVNSFGTTIGETMEFRTITLNSPSASWELIVGGSGLGPFEGGIEGVDFRWIGDNHMTTVKRFVAVANNRFWYEEA